MKTRSNSSRVKAPDQLTVSQPLSLVTDHAAMKGLGESSSGEAQVLMTTAGKLAKPDLRVHLRIATWNVLTLARTGYLTSLVREVDRLDIDIAGITEARLKDNGDKTIEGYVIYHSGGSQSHRGVALVIKRHLANSIKEWQPISDRLLYVRMGHRHGCITLIVAYAPTEDSASADKDIFYQQLESLTQSTHTHDQLIILGDLNAVTGTDRSGFERVIGPFGSGTPNDNSDRLLSYCATFGLSAVGSWFRRKDIHRWTWLSNDGVTKKEIDHMLTRNRDCFKSYRVHRGAECAANTDHRLVVACISVRLIKMRKRPRMLKYDIDRLKSNSAVANQYDIELQNRFSALGDLPDDVEDLWSSVRQVITETASAVVGQEKKLRKPWLSKEAGELIEKKRHAVLTGNKRERNRLKRAFDSRAKDDREGYYNKIAQEAETAAASNNLKPIYRSIRTLSAKPAHSNAVLISHADGRPCRSDEDIMARWKEYYEQALNHCPADPCPELDQEAAIAEEDESVPSDAPTLDEVQCAVRKLKNGRAAGADGIVAELLKTALSTTSKVLHELFIRIWRTGHVPAEWRDGIITSLYKGKGAKDQCTSYRPITLLSVPGKVFAHILLTRINPLLTSHRRHQQSGFTAGRSTVDAILALRLLSELHCAFDRPLYVAFVDLKSAFDSVDRAALWKALRSTGVPQIVLDLIKDLYTGTQSRVRVKGCLSEPFNTISGVRQGCVLAPAIFCRAIDWILQRALTNCGINLTGTTFTDTDYADDIAVVESDINKLPNVLQNIEQESAKLGLHISWTKTKIQNIGTGSLAATLPVLGQNVEGVDRFIYLGSLIDSPGGCRTECLRRIGLASSCMRDLAAVWKQKHLSLETKLRLYSSLVTPVLLYGSDTWTLTKSELSRLQAFHMRNQRLIMNIRWYDKVRNVEIATRTGLPHIGTIIQRQRHALFGHVVRLNSDTPANQALALHKDINEGRRTPQGWRRSRGRPRTTWIQQVRADTKLPASTAWRRATDRLRWRVDATALQGYAVQ
jgi:hypothetical protein